MEINNTDTNIDNDTDTNIDNDTNTNNSKNLYYVQQFQHKIFKWIPGKIRKNAQDINIFTYNFKPYHVAIGININLIDDYQKYKWKSPIVNVGPNSDIISFDYSNCKLIINKNCLSNNRYKHIGDVFKNTYDIYQN
jgi:hypothetical protein